MKVLFEIIILIISVLYLSLIYSFHWADSDNIINLELRSSIISKPVLKKVFNLNQIGDNKFTYIDNQNETITIEIDATSDITLNPKLKDWLIELIEDLLNKKAIVIFDNNNPINSKLSYSDEDLFQLTKSSSQFQTESYLHLIYLTSSKEVSSYAGRVVNQDTIFMFDTVIQSLSDRQEIKDSIELSTIKHELGHLLGIKHLSIDNCVMSEKVEVLGNYRYQGGNIPTEYCPQTTFQIKKLKSSIN